MFYVLVLFANIHPVDGFRDVYLFTEPEFETQKACMESVLNEQDIKIYVNSMLRRYKGKLPGEIDKVVCANKELIKQLNISPVSDTIDT